MKKQPGYCIVLFFACVFVWCGWVGSTEAASRKVGRAVAIKGLKGAKAVWIPKGKFMMGSPKGERSRFEDEARRLVKIGRGFYMMQTEVTQVQFKKLMGYNPSVFRKCGKDCPVERVSWHEAASFANKLSKKQRLETCFFCAGKGIHTRCKVKSHVRYLECKGWKLPTEAQWEYAARAGTNTPFHTGQNISTEKANYNGYYPYRNHTYGINRKTTVPVKRFTPNKWGLYQMHGNVWEWVYNWYGKYTLDSVLDPIGLSKGSLRVMRGGSWYDYASNIRSAVRSYQRPTSRCHFRVVRSFPTRVPSVTRVCNIGFRLVRENL